MALRCRKNQSTLTPNERAKFVAAVLALRVNGKYDQYVQWHVDSMPNAHRGPAFLPWHREFLRRYELDLQAVDATVTLPYWDWTIDNSAAATIWDATLMGGNGRPSDGRVMTGPFAFDAGNWTLTIDGPDLRRRFGVSALAPTLPVPGDVTAALGDATYDVSPWSSLSASGFRNRLEGWINGPQTHNRVHVWVGGSMSPASSPNDPVFFLHHCFVDKLWADWQAMHPGAAYLPASGAGAGHNLTDSMEPWASLGSIVTPASVLDHHALGYAYDTEGVCRPTLKIFDDRPTLKFIDDRPTLKFRDDRPTLKFLDEPQTLKFRDDRPTLKLLDDPQTLKFSDDPQTLKFADDPQTRKFTDDPQTSKFTDDPQTSKFTDDPQTSKFTDDPQTSKFTDDPQTSKFIDDPQTSKLLGDLPDPSPLTTQGGSAPFVLATPHHSMAWAQTFPEAFDAMIAELEGRAAELSNAIAEREAAQQSGLLTAEEAGELPALRHELNAVAAEYEQMTRQGR